MTRPISLPSFTERPHGSRLRYASGCKCILCRSANARYRIIRRTAGKSGDWNGIVSAARARKHLLILKRFGIGRRLIHEASGVAIGVIADIRSGKQQFIRARTERLLLLVDRNVKSGSTLVPAAPTWARIAELLEEGFTKRSLATRLGYKSGKLHFRRDRVTAATEAKVEQFYRRVMEGGS